MRHPSYLFITTLALFIGGCEPPQRSAPAPLKKDTRPIDPYGQRYTIGHLDHRPVNLDSSTYLIEYHDSAGWKPDPKVRYKLHRERSYDDAIVSFGFDIRMDGLLNLIWYQAPQEGAIAYAKERDTVTSEWLSVGVNANERYAGALYGVKSFQSHLSELQTSREDSPWITTDLQASERYGLKILLPSDAIDPKTGRAWRNNENADIRYLNVGEDGIIYSAITCTPYERYPLARSCQHHFSLYPDWRVNLAVRYRIHLLPRWQEVEKIVTKQMYSYLVNQGEQYEHASTFN